MSESFKDVVGYEGLYEVGDMGTVRLVGGAVVPQAIARNGYAYVQLTKDGKLRFHTAHALVAAAFLGVCPLGSCVNHINRDDADNRLSNLRYATAAESAATRRKNSNNVSGHRGVSKAGKRWAAILTKDGVRHQLGTFLTVEEAGAAYRAAAATHYGEFAQPIAVLTGDAVTEE